MVKYSYLWYMLTVHVHMAVDVRLNILSLSRVGVALKGVANRSGVQLKTAKVGRLSEHL